MEEKDFVDTRDQAKKKETELKVQEFTSLLRDEQTYFGQVVLGIRVLFLSCDEQIRSMASTKLNNGGNYTVFTIEDIKEMFPNMPEFEIEKRSLEYADVIVVIEAENAQKSERCPGLVSECTYIMLHKHLQDKTIFIVPDTLTYHNITRLDAMHYIYFPAIYFCNYSKQDYLAQLAADLARKEVHRLAHALNNAGSDSSLKNLYRKNNK